MEKKGRKQKVKEEIKMDEKSYKDEVKQKNTRKITVKSISVILIVVILAVTVLTVMLSINTTNKTEETVIQSMAQNGDYIKEIERVTQSNENMTMVTAADGVQVPVPKGYVGSEAEGENKVSRRVCNI